MRELPRHVHERGHRHSGNHDYRDDWRAQSRRDRQLMVWSMICFAIFNAWITAGIFLIMILLVLR